VIGGVVYRGHRISQLYGAYVFGDNGSGNLWSLRYDGTHTVPFQRIASAGGPAAFGVDPHNGDVLVAQLNNNSIGRLDYTGQPAGTLLPATLADTGAFSDLKSLTPEAGIVPYDINVPFWSDNAQKTRWFSVPDTNLTIGFSPDHNWSFPTGAVWIKHFELELTNGVPASRKRLETRFIVRNTNGVYGITYRWTSSTNATLVPEEGLDEAFVIQDQGTVRTQIWHYPSRAECLSCHTAVGGLALGFNTAQLNKTFDDGAGPTNQIAALSQAGYFSSPVTNLNTLRALAPLTNTAYSVEYRVHSYLIANCAQCHQPGGSAIGSWDAGVRTPVSQAGIVNGILLNDFGDTNNRVMAPNSLEHSVLLKRISTRGSGQMPPLDSTMLDNEAIQLLSSWTTGDLPNYQSFAAWQLAHFGSTSSPDAAADADPDKDGANNLLEFLTFSDPLASGDSWKISVQQRGATVEIVFPQIANRGFQVEWTPSLTPPVNWQPLDVPGNQPFFSAVNLTGTITDTIADDPFRFYRVTVLEP
jgi:mono/diheme cytochrome c family protein